MTQILETRRLTPVTKYFKLDAPLIAASAKPWQFVMLRVRDGGERIPITIADYDRAAGTLSIVVQAVGATTMRVCGRSRRAAAGTASPCPARFRPGRRSAHVSASCRSRSCSSRRSLMPTRDFPSAR